MRQDFYKLANRIHTDETSVFPEKPFTGKPFTERPFTEKPFTGKPFTGKPCAQKPFLTETPDGFNSHAYKQSVLAAIRGEKRTARRKRLTAAAACIALLAAVTSLFHNEVQAAISRISYSLSAAMGLESDLAPYKEIVNTSVGSGGYVLTLQEAAAAPGKLAASYTIQREDGKPLEAPFDFDGSLYINGQKNTGACVMSKDFLDDGQKTMGGKICWDVPDTDLSAQNTYEITFHHNRQSWDFKFTASGQDMYADTRRMALGNTYTLPDQTAITLDELTINDLEQRVTFHTASPDIDAKYAILLRAIDEKGRTTQFYASQYENGSGYLANEEKSYDGHIAKDAGTVTVTMYAIEFVNAGEKTDEGQVMAGKDEVPLPLKEAADAKGGSNNHTADGQIQQTKTVTWDLTQLK